MVFLTPAAAPQPTHFFCVSSCMSACVSVQHIHFAGAHLFSRWLIKCWHLPDTVWVKVKLLKPEFHVLSFLLLLLLSLDGYHERKVSSHYANPSVECLCFWEESKREIRIHLKSRMLISEWPIETQRQTMLEIFFILALTLMSITFFVSVALSEGF